MGVLKIVLFVICLYVVIVWVKVLFSFIISIALRNRNVAYVDRRPLRLTATAAAICLEMLSILRIQAVMVYRFFVRSRRKTAIVYLDSAKTPILLVPGFGAFAPCMGSLGHMLRSRGSGPVFEFQPGVMFAPIEEFANRLSARIDSILKSTGADRIDLVGHSMGGLVARYYIEQLGGDSKVRRCVTIHTPHHGTILAFLVPGENTRQMRPHSTFLTRLNFMETDPRRRRISSIWSPFDNIVIPPTSSILGGSARNIRIDYMPHFS
ncbi:MAG: alpha/beta fold hydrolase, partial [Candidatus Hydrogenedentes bacterium]|nr:alpha/beta fold hydrolase [Candidatus Hydrogenedentota bacterium]